jgi:hypothetical protein
MRLVWELFGGAILGAGLALLRFGRTEWQEWLAFSLIFVGLEFIIQAEIRDALNSFRPQVRAIADEAVNDAFTKRVLER